MLASHLQPTANGNYSWRRREAAIGRGPLGQHCFSDFRFISWLDAHQGSRAEGGRRLRRLGVGEAAWVFDRIEGHRLSPEGYRVWPPAKVHMAARWELPDKRDHESSEIAL